MDEEEDEVFIKKGVVSRTSLGEYREGASLVTEKGMLDDVEDITKTSIKRTRQNAKEKELIETLKQKDTIIAQKETENQGLTKLVNDLQQRLQYLERQLGFKQQQEKREEEKETDSEEEIVNKETAWIVQQNKRKNKKRKMKESPEISPQKSENMQTDKQKKQQNASHNKNNEAEGELKQKQSMPPPIIVTQVRDYEDLRKNLLAAQFNFKVTLLNNEEIKLNTMSIDDYRKVTALITSMGYRWHTYEVKQNRPIKVIVRNLHPTCNPEEIHNELECNGFKIHGVTNILRRETKKIDNNNQVMRTVIKRPLPLFMLTFESTENIKKIYEINTLQNTKIKIEPIRSPKLVPQCKRCQRFGHTQRFCGRDPVCVKCAQKHHTKDCTKPVTAPPKCANCGQAHPASYRGCDVAKEIQLRRERVNKKYTNAKSSQEKWVLVNNAQRKSGQSYAQTVTNNVDRVKDEPTLSQIMNMLNTILNRVTKLEEATFSRTS